MAEFYPCLEATGIFSTISSSADLDSIFRPFVIHLWESDKARRDWDEGWKESLLSETAGWDEDVTVGNPFQRNSIGRPRCGV